jgi:hypothetical protein
MNLSDNLHNKATKNGGYSLLDNMPETTWPSPEMSDTELIENKKNNEANLDKYFGIE